MKLKNISCTQFAGIRDCNISFSDGINVIYGKNESGKSTAVNLIARTLFQRDKLDRRSNKDFYELYFPTAHRNSSLTGDFADGKLTFETEQGVFTLLKEWGAGARCELSTAAGVVRDRDKIDEILKSVLIYGEGVYSEFLFSSQRNTDTALKALLDSKRATDAKTELTDVISKAFAESDGVSIDVIERAIQAKIDKLVGSHWDLERGIPERKTGGGRWSKGCGEILEAYYAMEDAKNVLQDISKLESEADRAASDYTNKDKEARNAEEAYNRFNNYAAALSLQIERKKTLERLNNELKKLQKILDVWPDLVQTLGRARALYDEGQNRELLDKYNEARALVDEIQPLSAKASALCPTEDEIKQVKAEQREISRLENRLCDMNLTAAVKMLGENTVEITSVLSGERVDISNGLATLKEAVIITIPGVMEMCLSPADVNITEIENEILEKKKKIADILKKYAVDSADALDILAKNVSDAKTRLEDKNRQLTIKLGKKTFEELEAAAKLTTDIRDSREIENDISSLCGGDDISSFITKRETIIGGYASEYGGIDNLKTKLSDLETEIKKAQASVDEAENPPTEYADISDPEAHLEQLKKNHKQKQELREEALKLKVDSASKLERTMDGCQGEPLADAEKAECEFNEIKSLLSHWLNIRQAFDAQKEKLNANPMQDIAESFTKYLGIISGGIISSEFPESDKLSMNVYSSDRLMDYGKLSEGTKETVSLAFRLSVLDHLFPNGGGVIVLDDPFTDMDAERTEQGCALLKECAKRHQVIFLTCREEYLERLNGNEIRV